MPISVRQNLSKIGCREPPKNSLIADRRSGRAKVFSGFSSDVCRITAGWPFPQAQAFASPAPESAVAIDPIRRPAPAPG